MAITKEGTEFPLPVHHLKGQYPDEVLEDTLAWKKTVENHGVDFLNAVDLLGGEVSKFDPNNQYYFTIKHENRYFFASCVYIQKHKQLKELAKKNRMEKIHNITNSFLSVGIKGVKYKEITEAISLEEDLEIEDDGSFNALILAIVCDFLGAEGIQIK